MKTKVELGIHPIFGSIYQKYFLDSSKSSCEYISEKSFLKLIVASVITVQTKQYTQETLFLVRAQTKQ